MLSSFHLAVLKTVIYADIFDYPLRKVEILKRLIGCEAREDESVGNLKYLASKEGYYFLKGRKKIVEIRKKRKVSSQKKITTAKTISKILKMIPTIKLIGISGALAVKGDVVDYKISCINPAYIFGKETIPVK